MYLLLNALIESINLALDLTLTILSRIKITYDFSTAVYIFVRINRISWDLEKKFNYKLKVRKLAFTEQPSISGLMKGLLS